MIVSLTSNSQNIVSGCTDSLACNYDSLATIDDGSCLYPIFAPYHEDFGSGILPTGAVCSWSQSAIIGDGWRFDSLPGYAASYNGRDTGTYAWIDFSNQDAGVVLEIEVIDISNLILPGLFFDFYSYVDTFGTSPPLNILNVETWDGTMWVLQGSFQMNIPGWNTQFKYLTNTAYINNLVKIRFRAESSVGADYFNDLLIDDVKIQEIVIGCSDSLACNYDSLVNIDDGSCIFPDGCTDSLACNYSSIAVCNDGSCCYSSPSITITVAACDSYIWDGYHYTTSGTYFDIDTNACGCDSTIVLDLWLSYTDSVFAIDTGYNSYNWNSQVLTSSGIYTEILTNTFGCDSIVTLNLTIINSTDILEINTKKRLIHKIINVLGKDMPFKRNEPLFYIYDDGTVEKRIVIE